MKAKVKAVLLETIKANASTDTITTVYSKVVLWSRADRIGGIRETATNLFVAGALTKAAWNEVLAAASAAVDQLNIAALNAA